jgi:predicted dehydrogenase
MGGMAKIRFGIVGWGWRVDFYMRIARKCPDWFQVVGVVVRKPEKGSAFEKEWGVPTFRTLEDMLLAVKPAFVVTSVPWEANPGVVKQIVEAGLPVLSETPPAPELEVLVDLYDFVERKKGKVQVAEQFHLRPNHQVQIALAHSGKIGEISQAQISAGHGYHGISLMRRLLGVDFQEAVIEGRHFSSPLVRGDGRYGPPDKSEVISSFQEFYRFEFEDRMGLIDFTFDQYFSFIRNERILVRGEKGEIANHDVYFMKDHLTPVHFTLRRHHDGTGGDFHHTSLRGIQAGEQWVYHNPFHGAPLNDEEIAMAHCLEKMARYVDKGEEFYPLGEACHDQYLYLLAQESVKTGEKVKTTPQPWSLGAAKLKPLGAAISAQEALSRRE